MPHVVTHPFVSHALGHHRATTVPPRKLLNMDSFEVNVDENDNESNDVDVHENVIHEDEPIESKMPKKRARNYSSLVWNFLTNLLYIVMENDVNIILDHAGRLRTKKIDQSVVHEMISMMIIEHDLPFSFVEHKRFKELLQYNICIMMRRLLLHNNDLVSCGEFFHIRCCAHILNLIVQEGLKVVGPAINKIRENIKYVKGSKGRMKVFKVCVAKVGGIHTKMGLRLDVITRWNSTFLMLESALVYRRAFCSLAFNDRSYSSYPTNEEWERGQKMCDFLCPFFQITKLIFGFSYPTSNLYFMQVWKIERLLLQNLSNEDELIRIMAIDMKTKFDKYWSDYINVFSFGCILDPRFKIKLLKYCYSKLGLDPISCQAKLKVVEHKLYTLYNEYVQMYSEQTTSNVGLSQGSSQETMATTSTISIAQVDAMDEFIQFEDEDMSQVGKSQLDTYLEEANIPNKYHPNLDVLQYWKDNQAVSRSLIIGLCIQITTVASESAFSIGSWVVNKYRIRFLADNVQALICTKIGY
ncbi:Zinc finger BED domain-containing protein RICESLEEPER 2 [Glycine soja]|uniref:hAT-like transposase RNase-H fold domain-containing protein n=2 Tax=Glycine subgen. Soja TaxID=1462606 RepID=A0A0R0JDM4_SOYBN|nr:Zinc finger BED domain-containing protein RICESLEEPER 2 [Glycine soja]